MWDYIATLKSYNRTLESTPRRIIIIAMQQRRLLLDSHRGIWNTGIMEQQEVVARAFAKSWHFVKFDPVLASGDRELLYERLSAHVTQLALLGERDVWRLANSAIAELRRESVAA